MSKTNVSPHIGLSTTKRGAASVVDADRTCIGFDERGTCAQRGQCKRHVMHQDRPSENPMRLPRVPGCACHYFVEVSKWAT